jgi:mycoredoxin-dependent peroxiredoxin
MGVEIGQPAPDFELKDHTGQVRKLSDYKGSKNVVLVFYPLAFSGICTAELCGIRDDLPTYDNDDTVTLAVSVDSGFVLRAFAEQQGYSFPLLSDFWPHGAIAQRYGVFSDDIGIALRGTFIIDKQGIVRYAVVNPPTQARDQEEYRKALASLAS